MVLSALQLLENREQTISRTVHSMSIRRHYLLTVGQTAVGLFTLSGRETALKGTLSFLRTYSTYHVRLLVTELRFFFIPVVEEYEASGSFTSSTCR